MNQLLELYLSKCYLQIHKYEDIFNRQKYKLNRIKIKKKKNIFDNDMIKHQYKTIHGSNKKDDE